MGINTCGYVCVREINHACVCAQVLDVYTSGNDRLLARVAGTEGSVTPVQAWPSGLGLGLGLRFRVRLRVRVRVRVRA